MIRILSCLLRKVRALSPFPSLPFARSLPLSLARSLFFLLLPLCAPLSLPLSPSPSLPPPISVSLCLSRSESVSLSLCFLTFPPPIPPSPPLSLPLPLPPPISGAGTMVRTPISRPGTPPPRSAGPGDRAGAGPRRPGIWGTPRARFPSACPPASRTYARRAAGPVRAPRALQPHRPSPLRAEGWCRECAAALHGGAGPPRVRRKHVNVQRKAVIFEV